MCPVKAIRLGVGVKKEIYFGILISKSGHRKKIEVQYLSSNSGKRQHWIASHSKLVKSMVQNLPPTNIGIKDCLIAIGRRRS